MTHIQGSRHRSRWERIVCTAQAHLAISIINALNRSIESLSMPPCSRRGNQCGSHETEVVRLIARVSKSVTHPIMHHILLLHLLGLHGSLSCSLLLSRFTLTAHKILNPRLGVLFQPGTVLRGDLWRILGWWSVLLHVPL